MSIFSFRTNQDLNVFLKTEYLGDLVKARFKLRQLSDDDEKKIRSILKKWENPQAVSNLLLHPSLIPKDIRISYLLKGLEEKEKPYYVLASVVGLQDIDLSELSEEEIKTIKEHLILILKTSGGVISARASVSICNFLSPEDASRAFSLLSHPDETTRHNILCWLIRIMEGTDSEKFISMANSSKIPEDVRKEAIERYQEYIKQKETGRFSSFAMQLYAYIPNLRETIKKGFDFSPV